MNNLLILYQTYENKNELSYNNWKSYCNKNDIKFIYFSDIVNQKFDRANQIFYFYKILKENNLDFNQICFVGDTTLIKQNTKNLFQLTQNKLTFAEWDSDFGYLINNIEIYNQLFFNKKLLNIDRFFDFGFFIVNKNHENIFDNIISFLDNNYDSLKNKLDTSFIPQNFFFDCEYNKLSYSYNMIDMNRKEIPIDENLNKFGFIFNFKNNIRCMNDAFKFI